MVYRCKVCGGELNPKDGQTVVKCEYCGNINAIPKNVDDNLNELLNRADELRRNCEFDSAEKAYEKIIDINSKEADAYWGWILSHYGIEYVKDPATGKRLPTCHRASFDAITADFNFKQALKYADALQRPVYEEEARVIDAIQKEILSISQKEEPYDVFICYKETDSFGQRTQDSVIANDIYYQLTQQGYKVFYAAITLEDKLGQDYEPIIFAALNSAKVMLVVGSKPEYFNAVWVRNEWSRFLKLMKSDRSKQLYPCYKGMNPYDLPEEFSHLQAQDMGKIGFINDIVRGIQRVIIKKQPESKTPEPKQNKTVADDKISPILKRAFLFCEDSQWNNANQYFEKVLDRNPENAEAYVGKLMIDLKVCRREQLGDQAEQFNLNGNFKKAYRFADDALKQELDGYLKKISDKIETRRLDGLYSEAVSLMKRANNAEDYNEAKNRFSAISSWKDSAAKAKQCYEKSEELRKSKIYADALALINSKDSEKIKQAATLLTGISDYKDSAELLAKIPELCEMAKEDKIYFSALKKYESNDIETIKTGITEFKSIENWRDSKSKIQESLTKIEALQEKAKKEREERERIAREKEIARVKRNKKIKKISIISAIVAVVLTAVMVLTFTVIVPRAKLKNADALVNNGKYDEAIKSYEDLGDYKDSGNKIRFLKALQNAKNVMNGSYDDAIKEMLESGATVTINYATDGGSFDSTESVQTLSLSVKNLSETAQDKSNTRVYRSIDEFSGLDSPARNGYNFVKWNLTDSKPSVSIGSISVTLNLTAEWNAKAYIIKYELNGGSVNGDNPLGYDAKDDDFTLINPTKVGYTFTGWSGTDIVGTSTSVTIASGSYGNRKFTANWQVNDYILNYDANGGESSETATTVTYDADYTLADANRTGYEFKGWFNEEGTKFDNGVWKIANNVTLIAKWEILTYSVKYNLDGGNASNKTTYTVEDTFVINKPFKTGYTFLGWTYEGQSTPVLSVTIDKEIGDKEYTANYKANPYTITFDADGGVLDKNSLSVTYDADYVLPRPEKDGYSFDGWYDGNTKIDNGVWKFDKNVSLKAKWVIYTLTTNANNEKAGTYTVFTQEKVTVGKKVSLEATTNDGYIFIGWCNGETVLSAELHYTFDMPDKTITYTAKWDKIPYTISYHNLDGATNNKANPFGYNVESDVITLLPATKVGYTFDGWFTDEGFGMQRLDIKTGSVGNIDLYAKWHANEYSVKFNENGGSKVEDKTAAFDSDFTLPTISRKGYTFNGWYNSDVKYESGVWKTPSDVTLTAKWTVITYNISYDLNGGTASNRSTYTVDDTFTLNNPTKTGYTFLGWTFNGQSVPQLTVTISDEIEDKSFTADYQANDYLVSFDAGIGSVTPSEKKATYDSEFELPVPTRGGYDFSGWFNGNTEYKNGIWKTPEAITLTAKWTARNDTKYAVNYCLENADDSNNTVIKTNVLHGTSDTNITPEVISYTGFISPAAQTVNIDADGNCVVNYYYKRITHTISFITNGGDEITAQTYKYEQTINLPKCTRNEFTFGGWFTNETLATKFATAKMPLNDITVYAWWSEENKPYEFTYSGSSFFTINGFNGNGEKLWVPSYIGDKPVTEIKTSAFEYKTDITKVVIPDTVTSIGKGAFKGCESIIDITLPFIGLSVESTANEAVFGFIFGEITTVAKKEAGTGTENKQFINRKLPLDTSAVWQYTCHDYYYYVSRYEGSYRLQSYYYYIPLTIKNVTITSQTEISVAAFNGCNFIESIKVPSSLAKIGEYAFNGCTSISKINSEINGEINIPQNVITISDYSFRNMESITNVVFSKSLTSIGDYAFSGCIGIRKINSNKNGELNLPIDVTTIGDYAFQNLELITAILVPDTVTNIGVGAFNGCNGIVDITLPYIGKELDTTGKFAVFGCIFGYTNDGSKNSSVGSSNDYVNNEYGAVDNAIWQYTCHDLIVSEFYGTYADTSYYYFIPKNIRNVTITVQTKIPVAAFNNCDFIENITLPQTVSIGDYAFQNCSATVNKTYNPTISVWDGIESGTNFIGQGTNDDPYQINNAADFAYLAKSVNGGEDYNGKVFILNININFNSKEWVPVGNKQHPFAGVFNGNGKKIYNLSINGDLQYVGLFGYITGTVMNLGIDSGTIVPITSGASAYVGSIAGCVSGMIENCYSKATINVNVKNMVYAGGLVGYTESTAIIRNSFASGNIKIISSDSMSYAGGLVGNNKGKIISCLAYGNVTAKGGSESYSRNGGLVGNNTGTTTDCYRSESQVLTKYTSVGVAFNEDGTIATEAEMLEYCKANWGNEWDYSSSHPELKR